MDHGLGSSRVRISWSLFMGSCLLLHGELGMISVWFMGLGLGFMGSGFHGVRGDDLPLVHG